jgi:hypothetical protein
MIKRVSFLAVLLFIAIICNGQFFEGRIVYQNTFKSKLSDLSSEPFYSLMGSMQEFYIKGGNFKLIPNGTIYQWQLYTNKDNRLYNKMVDSKIVFWSDGKNNYDEILKAEINTNVTEILGLVCDELILTCKNGIYKYYYNSKYKIDSEQFEMLKDGHWSDIYSLTKSVTLKMVIDNELLIQESTAIEIKEMKLEDSFFSIPEDSQLEKNIF